MNKNPWLMLDDVRKAEQERIDNLRGSMENSGQEKDTVAVARIQALMAHFLNSPTAVLALIEKYDAAFADARNAVLEEAAKACEQGDLGYGEATKATLRDAARAIRALKRE